MKKKIITAAISALMAISLAACGNSVSSTSSADSVQTPNTASTATADAAGSNSSSGSAASGTAASGNGKALIVYFDYSENMGDTSKMSADAITSASLDGSKISGIKTNDLLVMKDEIKNQTGADEFSVQVTDPYDPDYDKMVNAAQEDQTNNKKFSFKNSLPDLSGYDTIYMGMPVWWGGLPQPMVSFLDQNDFSGKTIIPFGINLGSGFGQMIDQIKEAEPDATVSDDGLTENSHTANSKVISDVDAWLKNL